MRTTPMFATAALAVLAAACGDSSGSTDGSVVRFNLATRAAAGAALNGAAVMAPVEYTDGTNTLVIESVKMVLKEIELEQDDDDGIACAVGTQDDDDCEELEFGPVLVDLPLGAGAVAEIAVEVTPGSYDELEFKIHKPEDDDAAFVAANPDFADASIRVTGTWNGAPFVFETNLSEEQEIDLVPPLVVGETQAVNLTLFVDIATWFRDGSALINPATATTGQPNESKVEENIKVSLNAFEDDDRDGDDDSDD